LLTTSGTGEEIAAPAPTPAEPAEPINPGSSLLQTNKVSYTIDSIFEPLNYKNPRFKGLKGHTI